MLRNGKVEELHWDHLHVGDVIMVKYGMEVPVDGLALSAVQMNLDEAAMTGESDACKKETFSMCMKKHEELRLKNLAEKKEGADNMHRAHELPSPLILSGTACAGGEGSMIAIAVGSRSAIGVIEELSDKGPQEETTPLQAKLEVIATDIGKVGTFVALLVVHVLLLRWLIEGMQDRDGVTNIAIVNPEGENRLGEHLMVWVEYLIIGVAFIVVAVPEGLPLAVMISLAYSIKKMLVDHCDVKKLASCEIMGGANNICSDKTGTLTLNKMTVTNVWAGKDVELPSEQTADKKLTKIKWEDYLKVPGTVQLIEQAIACNSSEDAGATDRAMLDLLERCGTERKALQQQHFPAENLIRFPFDSDRKRVSTVIENVGEGLYKRLHIKGASELITACCSHYIDASGESKPLNDIVREEIDSLIKSYAQRALRTIAVAYKNI